MALKYVIDALVEVPGNMRELYKPTAGGKFTIDVDGLPDTSKLSEFRDRNIAQAKELEELRPLKTKFEGIDPDAAKAALAQVAELATRPDSAKLAADLAAEKAAHAKTQLTHQVTQEFLRVGGRASAVDWMAQRAAETFAVVDGKISTAEFSAVKPAESLSLGEWMETQIKTADFAFLPSAGGGARGSAPSPQFGARSNVRVLKNPTPQQLGEHASAIANGTVKVEHS